MGTSWTKHPAFAYVAPFAAYLALLTLNGCLPSGRAAAEPLRLVGATVILLVFSRPLVRFDVVRPAGSVLVGVLVFAGWVVPDLLWPGHRTHWLFQNPLAGAAASTIAPAIRSDVAFLFSRLATTLILVPIIEELFWRGWLLRYLTVRHFESSPIGRATPLAFWISAVLFASEHGPYWDVGLLAGAAYNWWAGKTGRLSDCILAHAVTNACLAAYVLASGRWEYWL